MDAADWHRVKAVFKEALHRSADEQHAYVSEACGRNDAVRRASIASRPPATQASPRARNPVVAERPT